MSSKSIWHIRGARALAAALFMGTLAACGGGGGGAGGSSPPASTGSAPVIALQPVSQTVNEGETATFTSGASGDAPITYQWQRNGVDIPGATATSYTTLPLTAAADNGAVFRVVASNGAGSATSNAATLQVNPVPASLGLTITGPAAAPTGGSFSSLLPVVGGPTGPTCAVSSGATRCSSNVIVVWSETRSEHISINLMSSFLPPPGAAPGTNLNGVFLQYSVALQAGFELSCLPSFDGTTGCDLAALGITVDASARRVRFVNTPVSPAGSPGAPGIVLNGTLAY